MSELLQGKARPLDARTGRPQIQSLSTYQKQELVIRDRSEIQMHVLLLWKYGIYRTCSLSFSLLLAFPLLDVSGLLRGQACTFAASHMCLLIAQTVTKLAWHVGIPDMPTPSFASCLCRVSLL